MAVRKRGGVWYYDFQIKKIRYRGSIPEAQNKSEAVRAEAQVRTSVFEGKYGKPSGEAIFMDYAKNVFLPWSKENKASHLNDKYKIEGPFEEFFGKMCFKQITPMIVERFKRLRQVTKTKTETDRKPASVNRELQLLSKIFNLAIRDGQTLENPCQHVRKLREDNRRTRYLSDDEETDLLAQLTGTRAHLRPIVLLAIYTGMRKGEIFNLRWLDVDFQRGFINVGKTKNGHSRWIPMNALVVDALTELKAETDGNPLVFPSVRTGERIIDIKKGFRKACDEAKIPNLRFHDLRHTTATRLGEGGTEITTIAEFLGHRDLRMTQRYTHATSDSLRRAAVVLEQKPVADRKNVTDMSQKRKSG